LFLIILFVVTIKKAPGILPGPEYVYNKHSYDITYPRLSLYATTTVYLLFDNSYRMQICNHNFKWANKFWFEPYTQSL